MFIDNILLAELNTIAGLHGALSANDIRDATKLYQDDRLCVCDVGSFPNPLMRSKVVVHSLTFYIRNKYESTAEMQEELDAICAAICKHYGHDFHKCYKFQLIEQ